MKKETAKERRAREYYKWYVTNEQNKRAARARNQERKRARWVKENGTTKEEYAGYLKDERWFERRDEIYKLKGRVCSKCGSKSDLQIHHLQYTGKYPWEAPDKHLVVLCRSCHTKEHTPRERKNLH